MAGRHIERKGSIFSRFTRKQWIGAAAAAIAVVLIATGGAIAAWRNSGSRASRITEYSVSDLKDGSQDVSRSTIREALEEHRGGADRNTTYVRVEINGKLRMVAGSDFTTVKSVLQAGNITLTNDDTVSPSLDDQVNESTVIKITSTNSEIQTLEQSIPFNVIRKNDDSLPSGSTKVETEGKEGTMEITNLVTKNGTETLATNTITEYVKNAPINKVILVGTKKAASTSTPERKSASPSSSSSASYGTTMPVGDAQSYAHSKVLARGWSESEFTCLVQLWQKESGWRSNAANPSGAYGIPQALPGSKMGAGWQTDATVQINWGLNYIAGRYSTPCGAWAHSRKTGWY